MATKQQIITSIERHVRNNGAGGIFWGYSTWYVGITENYKRRKREHGHPEKWKRWEASTSKVAREVEQHFLNKGMEGGSGGGTDTVYIYVY